MRILGIETATVVCGVAVVENGNVLSESFLIERNMHAEMLMDQVDRVIRGSGVGLADMDGIAVSIGPGSFTGLRIGLSSAKGLAWGVDKPIVPIATLRALAVRGIEGCGIPLPALVLPILNARQGEVYCQLFEVDEEGNISELWGPKAMSVQDLFREVGEREVILTGEGAGAIRSEMEHRKPPAPRLSFLTGDLARCSAASIALEGERRLRENCPVDIASLEPLYIAEFHIKSPAGSA